MKFSAVLGFAAAALAAPTASSSSASTATSAPQREAYVWDEGWAQDYTIHSSCNATQYTQIYAGLQETKILAAHARDHTLKFGNSSEFYVKYFGQAPTAEVIGWYEAIVNADHSDALFRCDNPDGNCALEGWAGHWRGENGTNESVICDLSYQTRLYLTQMCSRGYTVAGSPNNVFWAGDLLHRLWHTSTVGQGVVDHYADEYTACIDLAKTTPEEAVRNSATLRYYALDVYAYDIAIPGVGCTGEPPAAESEQEAPASSGAPSSTTTAAGDLPSECHTHANGETHCS